MSYVICYIFSEATTAVLERFTNSTGKHLCWSLFLKKLQACRPMSCFKNTKDLSLFYWEHFYGFSESDLWKRRKKTSHNKHIYIHGSQKFWSFMNFYFVYIVKVCFVSKKTIIMLIFLRIRIKHSQYWEMRKNNCKLNFTKNRGTSWFSCGRLKISKCSISKGSQKVRLRHQKMLSLRSNLRFFISQKSHVLFLRYLRLFKSFY